MTEHCILQVEDEEADIFLLKHIFKKAGITNPVQAVTDGQMAIDYLAGNGAYADRQKYPLPALVLLDLKLPRKTGLEVLDWIRQQPGLKRLIVIAFSSSAFQEDINRCYDLGATCYIQKSGDLDSSIEMARLLKGWWLGCNRFGTSGVAESGAANCAKLAPRLVTPASVSPPLPDSSKSFTKSEVGK